MPKLFGRATITVDGLNLEHEVGASLDIGGLKRTPRPGANSAGGYTEELAPSKLEFDHQVDENTSLATLGAITGATVLFVMDTGQQYLVTDAYVADPPTATEGDGKAKITMNGPPAEEVS